MSDRYPAKGIQTRLARESVYGTTPGSPAYKKLTTIGVRLGASVEVEAYSPPGFLIPTIPLVNDNFGMAEVEGRLDFNGLAYAFDSLFGDAVITALGSGSYQWVWSWNGQDPLYPVSYVIASGFPGSADVANGFVFNSLGISGGRADGFEVDGNGLSKPLLAGQALGGQVNEVQTITPSGTWTSGTWTLTIVEIGQTVTGIAHNANAAAIQALINAVPGIRSGDIIVAGAPLSAATPVTLTYGGRFAGKNVAQATVNTTGITGGGTATPTTTTPGSDAATNVPAVPAGAILGNFYSDTSWATLGNTQVLHAYDMDFQIPERLVRTRPINKSMSSDGLVDSEEQEFTLDVTYGRNAFSDAQLAKLVAGTKYFPRMEWVHDRLIGASANPYRLRIDMCAIYNGVGMPDSTESVSTREFNSVMAYDETSGNALRIELQNELASL
jgi:hypothetical protein